MLVPGKRPRKVVTVRAVGIHLCTFPDAPQSGPASSRGLVFAGPSLVSEIILDVSKTTALTVIPFSLSNSFFFLSLFILEKEPKQGRGREREREGERERIPSRLHTVSTEPHTGFELPDHEIMT